MRISDWSSDVCSSDLVAAAVVGVLRFAQRLGCARQDVVAQGLRFVERSAKFAMQLIQGGLGLDLGVTRHAARALGLAGEVGSLAVGKHCDLAIWDIARPADLVGRIGFNQIVKASWRERVWQYV